MKKARFTESQIVTVWKEAEAGLSVTELCRKHGISDATFYTWRKKFGGMSESDLKRLRQLEEENRRLKHMYAELSIDHRILKDVVEKKWSYCFRTDEYIFLIREFWWIWLILQERYKIHDKNDYHHELCHSWIVFITSAMSMVRVKWLDILRQQKSRKRRARQHTSRIKCFSQPKCPPYNWNETKSGRRLQAQWSRCSRWT